MKQQTTFGLEWMKFLFQLIRLPNLLIIILTQVLIRYCILQNFLYTGHPEAISPFMDFILLVLATILITMGGYVINDYYDVKIDQINKPGRTVVTRFISYRGAIKLHLLLNFMAILIGFFLAFRVKVLSFGFIFPFIAGLLWLYSARYKRMLFWGNFLVALLSATVIFVVWLFDFYFLCLSPDIFTGVIPGQAWVSRLVIAYAVFAFLLSLSREIIKDMEDQEGDRALDCRTLPIIIGNRMTSLIVLVLLIITLLLMGFIQIILSHLDQQLLFWYLLIMIQLPLIILIFMLFFTHSKNGFHLMSNISKLIMLNGILSMLLFLIPK